MDNHKRICLITGATAGIGEAAAKAIAAMGYEMILVGRNPWKLEKVVREIRAQTGNESIRSMIADFSDLKQIRQLAYQARQTIPRLDVLINNAGAYFNRRHRTPYGVEKTFLVNHLAPFLLTNLLLDPLRKSPSARIVNVSSGSHWNARLDLNDLNFDRFYFGLRAYGRSKLANILFTYELARRIKETNITVNALHPGRVGTDIFKTDFSIFGPLLKWLVSRVSLTPEQGADNTIYLATSQEVEGVTGKYFVKRDAVPSSSISYDEDLARRLWETSETLTGLSPSVR